MIHTKINTCHKYFILIVLMVMIGCTTSTEGTKIVSTDYGELNPDAPKETTQWGRLAGEWECISKDLDLREPDNPKWYTNRATWKWEYILGGHAVFNQWWQEDTSPNPRTKEFFAAGMFIVNPETHLWEAVVINSRPHRIPSKFQAEYKNGKIIMNDTTGNWRVTFFDFTDESFEWKYEILTGDGEWKSISEISAKRKT